MTPGTVVGGKYRLLRQIGEGAMGQVWAAVNELTGGEVAIKLLPRPREDSRRRLLREARACGKLRHRNIIDVHDIGETDEGEPFLVMSLLSGETLGELLERKRRLDPPHAAQIARDVARALAAAHRAGFVHRDLKPANIFLHREEGEEGLVVKVLDFGVVKDLARSDGLATVAGLTVGSPAYMSPEQALASPDLDHRADIWALGVVLFEMLTGKRPFDGDSHQVVMKIIRSPVPSVTQLVRGAPPGLADLVARCLERDPRLRVASASELAEALDRFTRAAPPAGAAEVGPDAAPRGPDRRAPDAASALSSTHPQVAYTPNSALETLRVPSPLPPRARAGPTGTPGPSSSTAPLVRESHAPLIPPEPLPEPTAPAEEEAARPRRSLLVAVALGGVLLAALGLAVVHAMARPPLRVAPAAPGAWTDGDAVTMAPQAAPYPGPAERSPASPGPAVDVSTSPPPTVADAAATPPLHRTPPESTPTDPPAAAPDADATATSRAPNKAPSTPPVRPRRPSFLPRYP